MSLPAINLNVVLFTSHDLLDINFDDQTWQFAENVHIVSTVRKRMSPQSECLRRN